MSSVARFAWATLCFNVAVVLWGAIVRATGSGAGCGNKWPGCGGSVLGTSAKAQTIVEFTDRMTSGVALLMVAIFLLWCWRAISKGNWARYSATLVAVLAIGTTGTMAAPGDTLFPATSLHASVLQDFTSAGPLPR